MTALLALTEKLTESHPLEESLRAVTDAALVLLPANHASIRLLDASHSELLSGARSGAGMGTRPIHFRRGQGLIGWVVEYKESVCLDDVEKDPRFVAGKQGFSIRSMLAEPLWSAGQVIGVLSVSSQKRRAFDKDDRLLARLLANCCTPPVERARLRRLAMTDDLTLAYNQRYLSPRVNEEIERARRSGQPLSVLLVDLDHFKNVNDAHGHDVGDAVLRLFADRVRSIVRRVDVFIRRGGEEFLLLMPATALEQARNTAERIRRNLSNGELDVGAGKRVRQTVSIGVATWDFKESPDALQRRADAAMYSAKEQGRDRIVASAPPPSLLRMVK
jgi:diguanylate cyclase (GGDEF)-like protein